MQTFAPLLDPDLLDLVEAMMARHGLDRGIRHLDRYDVRQHLLMKCCEALTRYDPTSAAKPSSFLYRRIDGECKQLIRQHGTRTRKGYERPRPYSLSVVLARGAAVDPSDHDEPAEAASDSDVDELQDLRLGLAALPPKMRLVLYLLYYEELTPNEVARRLSSTLSAIRTIRDQALTKVRREMLDRANT